MRFKDKKKRTIQLEESDGIIKAYCIDDGGVCVGFIQFYVLCSGDEYTKETIIACPETANISEKYQKSGIATQIIKYAKTIYDDVYFSPDMGYGRKSNQIHYSDAGLSLKNSCERKGITRNIWLDEDYD